MDPLTQAALGAALAQSTAKPKETRLAAAIGALSGVLADADVLIRSTSDPLLTLEYHRHFSHALIFVPIGALIAALLLWPFVRRRLTFPRVYLFAFLGYSLSGVLDACTSYGTHLFWPFSDGRTSWNLIAIVDPIFTLVLLAAVVYAIAKRLPRAAWIGLGLAATYLLVGWFQQQRALGVVHELARARGHTIERVLAKPTLGNLLLWRTLYQEGETFHVDAVRAGVESTRVYEGGSTQRTLPMRDLTGLPPDSTAMRDSTRFNAFSDDFTAWHPKHRQILGDIRYSMTPNGLTPLWAIKIDFDQPDKHVKYRFFRQTSRQERQRFWSMLQGIDLAGNDS